MTDNINYVNWVGIGVYVAAGLAVTVAFGAFVDRSVRSVGAAVGLSPVVIRLGRILTWSAQALVVGEVASSVRPVPLLDVGPSWFTGLIGAQLDLGIVALVGALMVALRLLEAHRAPTRVVRSGGIVFALYVFPWWGETFAYLPVSLLATVAVAHLVLRGAPGEVLSDRLRTRLRALRSSLDRQRGMLLRRSRALLGSPGVGDDRSSDQSNDLVQLRKNLREAAAQLSRLPEPDRRARSMDGDWARAGRGALVGTVLGVPWDLIYPWQQRGGQALSGTFALSDTLNLLFWQLGQWTLAGLFFGYFYCWLRGNSGLAKAMGLVAVVGLPSLLYNAVWDDRAGWILYGQFLLELFVFAVLLGLWVGDSAVLHGVGLTWRQLPDLYNMRYVAVWGSAVAVALAGIVTSVATTGTQQVVSAIITQINSGATVNGGAAGASNTRGTGGAAVPNAPPTGR